MDSEFDPVFYRSYYPDLAAFDDSAAALHWQRHGRKEGRFPNAAATLPKNADPEFDRLPADFDGISYLYRNQDITAQHHEPTAAALHYLKYGIAEGRGYAQTASDPAFQATFRRLKSIPAQGDRRLQWVPPDAAHYLYLKGFSDSRFLASFDHAFYAAALMDGHRAAPAERDACIIHFADEGVERLAPIAQDLVFDAGFHRRQLRRDGFPLLELGDVELYRAWLARYAFDDHPPNHAREMRRRYGVACIGDHVVALGAYRFANEDLRALDDERLLEHVFCDGLLEKRSAIKLTPSNVGVFTRYASHLEATGALERAEAVYERLVHFAQDVPWLNQQYGDFLFRRERFAAAYRFYSRNIEARSASKWGYLNAASCCEQMADLGTCVEVLKAACRDYPEDHYLLRRRQAAAERFFADELGYGRALARSGDIEAAQRIAAEAAARCDFGVASVAPERPVRMVAIFANLDLPQCNLYRVEQKSEQLAAAGYEVRVYDWNFDGTAFHDDLAELDAVLFFRVAAFPGVIRAINAARTAGLATFYDVDDLVFDAADFPGPFVDYAGQIAPEHYAEICTGVPLFRAALRLCDYAIASTPGLAARMEPLVRRRRAFLHRNALGLRHEAAVEAKLAERSPDEPRPVTIFYGSGTKAHKLDVELILLPALREIDRRFGDKVRIVLVAHLPAGIDDATLARFHVSLPEADVEGYWRMLGKADIVLSVLRRTPATSAKSEIKWLEAAMFGVPSVVSATDTFEGVVTDGIDGFLATDADEFVEKISRLVRDPVQRAAMGEAARAKAMRDYRIPTAAAALRAMFESVAPARRERTRVLIVHVFYAPQAKGGATRVVIDNVRDIRALYPEEFEFEVFTTLEGGLRPYSVEMSAHDGVRITAMVAGDYPHIDHVAHDERVGAVFARCVERFAPQLIHFHCIQRITAAAPAVARAKRIPYVVTAHDGWWISDRQFLYGEDGPAPLYDFTRAAGLTSGPRTHTRRQGELLPALKGAAAVLAVSDAFAAVYRSTGLRNVRSVPNGLPSMPLDRRPPDAPRRAKVCLGHIGGLEPHKGFPLLRLAIVAAKPRNVTVLAVDLALEPGEERLDLWGETAVRIVARRKQDDMAALYAAIDVLVAPSLWPESFGLVTREALAAGCWVVASDRGAIGEPVVEGVNGHVVPVDTLAGLVGAIRRIDADPARYLVAPPPGPPPRTSRDQAHDLAALYRQLAAGTAADAEGSLCRAAPP